MARRFFGSPSFHSAAHVLAIASVAASVTQGILLQSGSTALLFAPDLTIFRLQVWRPFTTLLIGVTPLEVILNALILYSLGGTLEARWGKRRFVRLALGIPLVAEGIVLLLAALAPAAFYGMLYPGARPVITTLWVLFGLTAHFSGQVLNFWGSPVRGKTFALIGVGFAALNGVFGGFVPVLPELFAAGLCYAYMYRPRALGVGALRQRIELAYYTWKLERLKKRSKLRVVKGSREDGPNDPSQNVH